MLHARIAARAFNTPLMVEPAKAMAFLSGLGPRILGREVELADGDAAPEGDDTLPARAGILTNGLAESWQQSGRSPYPVIDGIAVIEIAGVLIHRGGWIGASSGQTSYEGLAAQIEAAASDPAVRGVALEIDSFGGEVAGVFDLADRIRALRRDKPVRAFVAEHAFSAGYALASQAERIVLPRTGAVGSIGVVVMHADLSGQLDRDGVRVTLIRSGRHKVDGNPYEPLPAEVRDDIQREIDVLRFLFAETVAAGRAGRLSDADALATEAGTFRGADAVAAGLADEVTDLAQGFAAFRRLISGPRTLSPARPQRAALPPPAKEANMATGDDQHDTSPAAEHEDSRADAAHEEGPAPEADAGPETAAAPALAVAPADAPVAPAASGEPTAAASAPAQPDNATEISAQLRQEAAEIAEIAAQAGRLGIAIDAAKALRDGTTPEALRRHVLERAAAATDARDIVAAPPALAQPQESPIVAAAKRTAAAGRA